VYIFEISIFYFADVNSINNKVSVPPSPSSLSRKQTHMITFLQDQVKSLSHEVLRLRAAAEFQGLVVDNKSSSKSGDMDHLLASKEQEMRAIAAERDKLRADSARLQERNEVLKKTVETMRDEREKNVAKISDLQKDNDSLNKKYQKMKVLLEVEQEAMQHAQSTILYYKGVAPAAPQ
jgi:chromosome segregation ATPase